MLNNLHDPLVECVSEVFGCQHETLLCVQTEVKEKGEELEELLLVTVLRLSEQDRVLDEAGIEQAIRLTDGDSSAETIRKTHLLHGDAHALAFANALLHTKDCSAERTLPFEVRSEGVEDVEDRYSGGEEQSHQFAEFDLIAFADSELLRHDSSQSSCTVFTLLNLVLKVNLYLK